MEFNVFERLMMLQVVPIAHQQKGNYVTQKALADFLGDIGFTDDEIEELDLQMRPDGQVKWDTEAEYAKDIEISPVRRQLVLESLQALEDRGQVTPQVFPLFAKFDWEDYLAAQEEEGEELERTVVDEDAMRDAILGAKRAA